MKCLFGHQYTFKLAQEIEVYGDGWGATQYPTSRRRIYEGTCERCGWLKVKKVTV